MRGDGSTPELLDASVDEQGLPDVRFRIFHDLSQGPGIDVLEVLGGSLPE